MSAAIETASGDAKPYKGPYSYAPEDGDLFFGRERIGEQLIAAILSSEFTVLHAPSGAGKTSLLNARVIGALEARGWYPVRTVPNDDPSESVRVAALHALVPPPAAEAVALRRALREFVSPTGDCTLEWLRWAYSQLEVRDPLRRRLIAPVSPDECGAGAGWSAEPVTPFVCRLLRGSLDVEALRAQFAAMAPEGADPPDVQEHTSAVRLAERLASEEYAAAYRELLAHLTVPVPGLHPFFENLTDVWASRHAELNLVLILDQFEELFTRFVDTGGEKQRSGQSALDWRLRTAFFEDLRSLYVATRVPDATILPIRFVISMREEFLARIAPLRSFVDESDLFSFGIGFLEREDAVSALGRPAEKYGYRYASKCFDHILASLLREDRFVEPTKLQIVCEKLWSTRGKELATAAAAARPQGADPASESPPLPEVEYDVYDELGGVEGILSDFFLQYLKDLDDPVDRFETLDLLSPLITTSRTRNIVELTQLVEAPYRDPVRRRKLLELLRNNSIVRIEARHGGLFVEITHEFLIQPVLKATAEEQQRDDLGNRFRFALRTLARREDDLRPNSMLTKEEFEALHRAGDRIRWPDWGLTLMLRSALRWGSGDQVVEWTHRYAGAATPDREALWTELKRDGAARRLLTLEELRLLGDPPDEAAAVEAGDLILRSLIAHGREPDGDLIRQWTRRTVNHAS